MKYLVFYIDGLFEYKVYDSLKEAEIEIKDYLESCREYDLRCDGRFLELDDLIKVYEIGKEIDVSLLDEDAKKQALGREKILKEETEKEEQKSLEFLAKKYKYKLVKEDQ